MVCKTLHAKVTCPDVYEQCLAGNHTYQEKNLSFVSTEKASEQSLIRDSKRKYLTTIFQLKNRPRSNAWANLQMSNKNNFTKDLT